jgi:putative protease
LDKIIEAGVKVLKIEGRGRAADYVFTTTQCYRQAVDAIAEGTYTPEKIEHWKAELSKVYNRGFWDGYYLGRKMGEWSNQYGSVATQKKVYLGKE